MFSFCAILIIELKEKEVKVMFNMTYDNLELYIGKMYKHIEHEIQHALKDEQYLDRETLLKVCRLRDSLKTALHATQEINALIPPK